MGINFKVLRLKLVRLLRDNRGNVAITFGLAFIPIAVAAGTAVDYSRGNSAKAKLQAILDNAVLAGANDGTSSWTQVARNAFSGNLGLRTFDGTANDPTFTLGTDPTSGLTYIGDATATVPTAILGLARINNLNIGVHAEAQKVEADNSCILTMDKGNSLSHVSLNLNGAPIVNLSGCSIRSNTSMACNGHDGNSTKSYASGTASACSRPTSNAPTVPDIYVDLAKNITPTCGATRSGASWSPGSSPTGSFNTASKGSYFEYHICGDLTISGTGNLPSDTPSTDTAIIIENGSLNILDSASINTLRTVIVLTGNNSYPAQINFPNGNGKQAKLVLSPPTSSSDPWQGISLYLDPKLTNNVDNRWGPGAEFDADGLVYLGNSNVVTDGNTASANSRCTTFVMKSFTTNGNVNLNFQQS